jgi:PAS domain S-box-containing protein
MIMKIAPDTRLSALANRAFLRRSVRFLSGQGIDQFIDLGSGIPTVGNVHEIAQKVIPQARTVYVDMDAVAVAHSRTILKGDPNTAVNEENFLNLESLLKKIDKTALIDLKKTVGVLLVSVMHFVPDDAMAHAFLKTLHSILPELLPRAPDLTQEAVQGKTIHNEFRLLRKNGTQQDILLRAVRTAIPGEEVLTGFVTDVTGRLKAENELRLSEACYRTLAETAQALIIIFDPDDRIEFINDFAANYANLPPEEIIGKPRSSFFHGQTNERMKHALDQAFERVTSKYAESKFVFPSGSIWLSFSVVPLRKNAGQIDLVIVVSPDITDIKNYQQDLEKSKKELENRVKERTASLEASQEQSRRLVRQIIGTQEEERCRVSRELHD